MVAILMVATVAGMAIPTHMAVATTTYAALCAALLFFPCPTPRHLAFRHVPIHLVDFYIFLLQ